jgi:hypothetical protein
MPPPHPIRVQLRRCRLAEGGRLITYTFTFHWTRRSAFIRPEHMPEADREADWDFAWYEVVRNGRVWSGVRRMATQYGDEPW